MLVIVCVVALVVVLGLVIFRAMAKKPATPETISYELKFLLDEDAVLDEDHELKAGALSDFGFDAATVSMPIEVLYLETPERAFQRQGWSNRLRIKFIDKVVAFERNHKWRTKLSATDDAAVAAALREAGQLGLPVDDAEAWEVDWGYAQMTLSASFGDKVKKSAKKVERAEVSNLSELSLEQAQWASSKTMPDIERDWSQKGWGKAQLKRTEIAGPLTFQRYRCVWGAVGKGQEVTFEVWPVPNDHFGVDYFCELSTTLTGYKEACALRERISTIFDGKGILPHEDALKTRAILSVYLGDEG